VGHEASLSCLDAASSGTNLQVVKKARHVVEGSSSVKELASSEVLARLHLVLEDYEDPLRSIISLFCACIHSAAGYRGTLQHTDGPSDSSSSLTFIISAHDY